MKYDLRILELNVSACLCKLDIILSAREYYHTLEHLSDISKKAMRTSVNKNCVGKTSVGT